MKVNLEKINHIQFDIKRTVCFEAGSVLFVISGAGVVRFFPQWF